MSSLVTTTTVRDVTIPATSLIFAGVAVATLIALLVVRELARALDDRASQLVAVLRIVIPPLLTVFVAIAATRLRVAV